MTQAQQFLEAVYLQLDFLSGDLVSSDLQCSDSSWLEKGDWATLTKDVGADKVFFVQENPVVVFAKKDSDDPETLRLLFKNVWCMSRPNFLFLASPGELAVYDLTKPPPRTQDEWERFSPLDIVRNISEVADKLKSYHRAQIESGKLFEEIRFGKSKYRADKSLIQDLRTVRAALMEKGLAGENLKYAHALIGRSIFIRYLEDRGILTPEYFKKVARGKQEWKAILKSSPNTPYVDSGMEQVCYLKILGDKDFTYALFHQLAKDFNGDMFPEDDNEKHVVTQGHLSLLQGFLRGDTEAQQKLFLWAYNFKIIPIELVSSIYEEFYTTKNKGKDSKGTHYTPPALVEFLLSQVLTQARLSSNPVILDPACGSGIFLVEAFRRIVRYRVQKQGGRRLSPMQLRKILREQIRGIDINEEAIRVAAFSLYLALLHYQQPPDILEQIKKKDKLPNLIRMKSRKECSDKSRLFDILYITNAFSDKAKMKVDVIVGNPPWGDAKKEDTDGRKQAKVALDWCTSHDYPIGDRERSQAFIWRSLDLLKENGCAGLLVSSGILHKHNSKSKAFRSQWLSKASLEQVVHFAHVRKAFFSSGIAPFISVVFRRSSCKADDNSFMYASAKKTSIVDGTQSVVISKHDIHFILQRDMVANDASWKILWWGNHHDKALTNHLSFAASLADYADLNNSRQGYTPGKKHEVKDKFKWLEEFSELPKDDLKERYRPIDWKHLKAVPPKVHRSGKRGAYSGLRLLVSRGIMEKCEPKGQVVARLQNEAFCFTNSINAIRLNNDDELHYKVLLGILWSSLSRYYFFLTCSGWGLWHHELHRDEILSLPVLFPSSDSIRNEIIVCVTVLRAMHSGMLDDDCFIQKWETRLDNAIFDLYELPNSERDLIKDMCDVGIPFFYDSFDSIGARPLELGTLPARTGVTSELHSCPTYRVDICGYLETFLDIWNRELDSEAEFSWRLIVPNHSSPMLAAVFSVQPKGSNPKQDSATDEQAWKKLLKELAEDLRTPFQSDRIYVDGLVRIVSPTQIIIIKRNEGRFWTRSAAREDAEATMLNAIQIDDGEAV